MNSFLDLIDRHKVGILATIALHLLVVTAVLVIQMRSKNVQQQKQMIVEFVQPEEMEKALQEMQKEINDKSRTEYAKELQEINAAKAIPVNEAEANAKKAIDDMERQIKNDLNITDNSPGDRESAANQPKPEEIQIKQDIAKVDNKKKDFINEKGEPTVWRGATTISYNLKDRTYTYIPTPQYKCEGGGKVVLDIIVNQQGMVVSAEINKAKSQITETCVARTAVEAARLTVFNEKPGAPARQPGTLTFVFIAQ